jgi:hypothetical protein
VTLDDLLRYEDDEPTPHRQEAPPSRYRWLVRPVVVALIGALSGWFILRLLGLAVPVTLIFMIVLAVQLLHRTLRWIDPRPLPSGLRQPTLAPDEETSAPADGMRLAVARWDTRLSWVRMQHDPHQFARTVQPRLVQLVDERLRLRHGLVRSADPARARAVLGDPLWTFMTTPVRTNVTPAELAALIRQMEEI